MKGIVREVMIAAVSIASFPFPLLKAEIFKHSSTRGEEIVMRTESREMASKKIQSFLS